MRAFFALCSFGCAAVAGEFPIVENRASPFVIHCEAHAGETARLAATELQRIILRATGAELRITDDPAASPAIGIAAENGQPHDGYEIRASGANIVIAGNDEFAPP